METVRLLRQSVVSKTDVVVGDDGVFHFGGQKFPGKTMTPYKRKNRPNNFTVADLYLFIQHNVLKKTKDYLKACKERKMVPVSLLQRKSMANYFKGLADSAPELETPDAKTDSARETSAAPKKDASGSAVASATGPVADIDDVAAIYEGEELALTRNTMLQSRTANFKGVLTFCEMAENDDKARLEKRSGKKRKSMGSSSAAVAAEALKKSRTRIVAQADYPPKHPIILVPSGSSGLLTLFNAKRFLEEGFYEDVQSARRRTRKPNKVMATRKHANGEVTYLVLDQVTRLSPNDWNRVVAVVALGPLWQFKKWFWKTPAEIFNNVAGFHFNEAGMPLKKEVAKLKVSVIEVSKTKRHRDAIAAKAFWDTLDASINHRKPWYTPGVWEPPAAAGQ